MYKSQYPIVCFSKKMNLFDISIKKFLREKMYFHKSVIKKLIMENMLLEDYF